MKFTVRAGDLRDAIDAVSRVVPKVPGQAVYGGIRLRVRDGALTVTGSAEGLTTMTVTVPVSDPTEGDRVLAPKPIATYLSGVNARTTLRVTATTSQLTVTPETGSPYTFRLMEATYPNTTPPSAQVFDVDLSRLGVAVKAVKDVAAATDAKVVQIASTPSGVRLNATDGLRLACAWVPEGQFGDFTGLLPLTVVERIGEHAMTQVSLDRRMRVFSAGNDQVRIVARLVDAVYPNVAAVLEHQRPEHTLVLPVRPLIERLNRLAAVASGRPVLVRLAGDQLTLSGDEVSTGAGAEHLELDQTVPGGDITIAVNLDYLREALSAHPAGNVHLGWTDAHTPLFLESSDPLPVTTVVMPLRV